MIHIKTDDYISLSIKELRAKVVDNFKKYRGSKVINKDKNITVEFGNARKLSFGGAMYSKKAAVSEKLEEIVLNAKFLNFSNAKAKDKKDIVGFINFKTKVHIDGKPNYVRFNVRIASNGKFYYSHEITIKKE